MAGVKGIAVKVGCYDEETYKVPFAVPSGELMYFSTFGVQPSQGRNASNVLSGFRGRTRSTLGLKTVAGAIASELAAESVCFMLKHLIGKPTTTGAGPYTHAFEVGDGAKAIPPGATFEVDYGAALTGAGRYIRYHGCRVGAGTFTFSANGPVPTSFTVMGADWDNTETSPLDATLTDPGHTSFSAANLAIVLNSGGVIDVCLQALTISWNNNLDDAQFCISDGGVRDGADEGLIDLTGTLTARFDNQALLNKVLADEDVSLVVTVQRGTGAGTTGNEKVVFNIPAVAFEITAPTVEGPKGVVFTANWSAHRTSGEIGAKVEVYNARATV